MKGHWISYSAVEMAWLEANRMMVISEYHRAFSECFSRDVSSINLHALRKRMGWKTGRTGRIEKGAVPHNKGVSCAPGSGGRHPNAQRTHFKPGDRTGKAALNYKPIGTERITKEGYRERKVNDDLSFKNRWQLVHRLEWESLYGPVPDGMVLKCRGDKLVTNPSNWDLVPRAILPRLNGGTRKTHIAYDTASDDLKAVILSVARLEYAARRAPHQPQPAAETGGAK